MASGVCGWRPTGHVGRGEAALEHARQAIEERLERGGEARVVGADALHALGDGEQVGGHTLNPLLSLARLCVVPQVPELRGVEERAIEERAVGERGVTEGFRADNPRDNLRLKVGG